MPTWLVGAGGAGSFADAGGADSFADEGGADSFADEGDTDSFADEGGAGSFADEGGADSFADEDGAGVVHALADENCGRIQWLRISPADTVFDLVNPRSAFHRLSGATSFVAEDGESSFADEECAGDDGASSFADEDGIGDKSALRFGLRGGCISGMPTDQLILRFIGFGAVIVRLEPYIALFPTDTARNVDTVRKASPRCNVCKVVYYRVIVYNNAFMSSVALGESKIYACIPALSWKFRFANA